MSIRIETKTNGYKAEGLQEMIAKFEKVAGLLFPDCTVRHFYYGDHLDFADIILGTGDHGNHYGSFNITAHRVSFNSHTCSEDEYKRFTMMTHRDELFDGKLLELADA